MKNKSKGRFSYALLVALFVCMSITACKRNAEEPAQEVEANVEKVKAVDTAVKSIQATGRVELVPTKSFSPVRGVICEFTGLDRGAPTGTCYDVNGPSLVYTGVYLSDVAAAFLNSKVLAGEFENATEFTTESGVSCVPEKQQCQAIEGADLSHAMVSRYNASMYGFPSPPAPPVVAPPPPLPPASSAPNELIDTSGVTP